MHVAWPSCAWLQLNFSPFPVGHPISAVCTVPPRDVRACMSRRKVRKARSKRWQTKPRVKSNFTLSYLRTLDSSLCGSKITEVEREAGTYQCAGGQWLYGIFRLLALEELTAEALPPWWWWWCDSPRWDETRRLRLYVRPICLGNCQVGEDKLSLPFPLSFIAFFCFSHRRFFLGVLCVKKIITLIKWM